MRDTTRMWLLIIGVFVVGQSEQGISDSDCKGLQGTFPRQPHFGQNNQKSHKMATTSVVCDLSMHSSVLRSNFSYHEFTCDTSVHKGQRGVIIATTYGTKIAIKSISIRETSRIWLFITGFSRGHWSANLKQPFLIARVYGTLPRQPNFGQSSQKCHKMAI